MNLPMTTPSLKIVAVIPIVSALMLSGTTLTCICESDTEVDVTEGVRGAR